MIFNLRWHRGSYCPMIPYSPENRCTTGTLTIFFYLLTQMTKKIKKLEKETTMYRSRWESSNKALLEMAEEVSACM